MKFNEEKFAEIVAEEARVKAELDEVNLRLNDQQDSDKNWEEARLAKYMADGNRQAVLSRQLETVRAERYRHEQFRPREDKPTNHASDAFARWLNGGVGALDDAEQTEFIGALEQGEVPMGDLAAGGNVFRLRGLPLNSPRPQAVTRSDTTSGSGAAGDAAVPEWEPGLVEALKYYGAVSRSAFNFSTSHGNTYNFNQMDSTSQEGGTIANQGSTTLSDQSLSVVNNIAFTAYIRHSETMSARLEAIADVQFDLPGRIMSEAMRRMGRGWNNWFTTGTNSSQPQGIVPSAKVLDAGGSSLSKVTYANLIDLEHEIDLGYLESDEGGDGGFSDTRNGFTGYMLNRNVEKILRKTVDADMRPIWVPDLFVGSAIQGRPATINGYPYIVNQHMDSGATNNHKPIIFGNFGHYGVRNVNSIDFFRFFDSSTVKSYSVQYIAFSRRDGRCIGPVSSSQSEAYVALQVKT